MTIQEFTTALLSNTPYHNLITSKELNDTFRSVYAEMFPKNDNEVYTTAAEARKEQRVLEAMWDKGCF